MTVATAAADLMRLIETWDGEAVISRFDRETGTWIFIALHDLTLGPASGGTRMRVYERPEDGLRDVMRLAEGMTHKWAVVGLDQGGGKAVLAVPAPLAGEARRGLLLRYGALVESLRGTFSTGGDLGTTPEDMGVIGEKTRFVHGIDPDGGEAMDPGPFTARGVFCGVRAVLGQAFGSDGPEGHTVVIQGVGLVGGPLARELAAAGARVLLADLDAARAAALAADLAAAGLDAEPLSSEAVFDTPCDVFAPCAVGGILDAGTIPRLACRAVAGSANNQLEEDEDAERLHRRGILYAPDYVINGGGALAFGLMSRGAVDRDTMDREALMRRVEGIGATLTEIFEEAAERGESPLHAARRRAERRLRGG